ncbi:hypothetical protein ACQR1I_19625 [Bradyrhizobium sp. HKCCYLS2038]|uniref:hypothetical protein n=1 Tax=unclassified Bradyrhizobium TaxID=2631580 RepID=UPI003EBE3221
MRRFEFYRVKRGDNLADPAFWNDRFQDLDLRIHQNELYGKEIAGAVDQITAAALARLNDTFTPAIIEVQHKLADATTLTAEIRTLLEGLQNEQAIDGGTF